MPRQDILQVSVVVQGAINKSGPIIGSFQGQSNRPHPIYAWIVHCDAIYEFERVIYGDKDGGIALDQLANDEILTSPGIVYKLTKE